MLKECLDEKNASRLIEGQSGITYVDDSESPDFDLKEPTFDSKTLLNSGICPFCSDD